MSKAPTVAVVHFPSPGHIRPMLPFAGALAGEELRVVQWAPADWEQACLAAGGEFRALPELEDLAWPRPGPLHLAEFLGGLSERLAPWMCEQLRDARADAVLRDSFAQYAHCAARVNGVDEFVVPAMMALERGMWDGPRDPRGLAGALAARLRLRAVSGRLARRYGAPLGGPASVLAGRHGSTTFVMSVPSLQRSPELLRGQDIRYLGPARALGPPEGDDEPALRGVADEDRVIYVSLGTVFEQQPEFFRDAARAVAAPGRRVILSVGRLDAAALGPLPAGVAAHAHVDQLAVLRRADLFLTHAGFNSVQEGLAAGVPLLLFPQMFEQELNAAAVVAQGAGLLCRVRTPEAIGAAATLLLEDPSHRRAAQRLAAELRAGSRLAEGVGLIAAAARSHAAERGED